MRELPMKKILFATVLCLLAAGHAFAQGDAPEGPFQVRIKAYVGDAPAGVKPSYVWTVKHEQENKTYTLQVMEHQSTSPTVSVMDVNDEVSPYQPNFNMAGDDKAVAALTSVKAGVLMNVWFEYKMGTQARSMMLDTVSPVEGK
jgi:hypothetical protein